MRPWVTTLLLLAVCPTFAFAQGAANLARGFDPEKVYQIGNLDHVNLFNGNLIIDIPIGPTYSVGAKLKYSFHLVYNGNPWDYEIVDPGETAEAAPSRFNNVAIGWQLTMGELVSPADPLNHSIDEGGDWLYVGPDASEHAFFPYLHNNEAGTSYAAAAAPAVNGVVGYTRDNSYLRLVRLSPTAFGSACRARYEVQFPDGEHHIFESVDSDTETCSSPPYSPESAFRYRLSRIEDAYGNYVSLDYSDASKIVVTDSANTDSGGTQRSHTISLADGAFYQYKNDTSQSRKRVTGVTLAADTGSTASTYSFGVTDPTSMDEISMPCADTTTTVDQYMYVIFLKSITRPDGSKLNLASSGGTGTPYYTMLGGTDSNGKVVCVDNAAFINRLDLPTGGHIAYTSQPWRFPTIPDWDLSSGVDPGLPDHPKTTFYTQSIGVTARNFYTDENTLDSTWTYRPTLTNPLAYSYDDPNLGPRTASIAQEEVVTVTDPNQMSTVHYFTVLREADEPDQTCGAGATDTWWKYGLPFTRDTSASDGGLFLSEEAYAAECVYPPFTSACTRTHCRDANNVELQPVKKTFVFYEGDIPYSSEAERWGAVNNSRLQQTRTSFFAPDVQTHDNVQTDSYDETSDSNDFDGLGHYRRETMSATASALSGESNPPMPVTTDRTVYTHYNANTQAGKYPSETDPSKYMIAPGDPWLTGLFDYVTTTLGSQTIKQEFGFDRTRGFLTSRRDLKNASGEGCSDVVALFNDSIHQHGDVEHEAYYGGDNNALPSPCGTSDVSGGTPDYAITHTYAAGALKTTSYDGSNFKSEDYDISAATGLVTTSRDSAGQATSYQYDSMFRLVQQDQPAGGASTAISYSYSAPSVTVDRKVSTGDSAHPGSTVNQYRFYYDGLGRMIESKTRMPDNGATQQWATTIQKYDKMGRVVTAYQPEYRSSGSYEDFTPSNTTTYAYDSLGRTTSTVLPDGSKVTQAYTGNRKIERTTFDANGASPAIGTVDNTVVETYNGHRQLAAVGERSLGTSADVVTTYTYDAANHLSGVSTTSGATTQTRSFTYDDRGWLKSESYPELNGGTKTYSLVDARGHAHKITTGSVDLLFDYDAAERVKTVTGSEGVLKEFTYATTNPNLTNPTRTNYEKGRLDTATRHNYSSADSSDVTVADQYEYDVLGRVNRKTTSLTSTLAAGNSPTQSLIQTYAFDAIGDLTTIGYPAVGTAPARSLSQMFSNGLLTGLSLASTSDTSFTYFPTGMLQTTSHADSTTDTVTADHGMARPSSIGFSGFAGCTVAQPVITTPTSVCANGTDHVSVPYVRGSTYSWNVSGGQITGTSSDGSNSYATFTAGSSGSVTFTLTVTNNCGSSTFDAPAIPISSVSATVTGSTTTSPNTSVQIQAALAGSAPWTVTWNDGYQQTVPVGGGSIAYRTVTVSATTDFSVTTATDGKGCTAAGSGTAHITIVVPAPASIHATVQSDGITIQVTWASVNYATYHVYRDGTNIGSSSSTAFNDTVTNGTGHLYTVRAVVSGNESADSPRYVIAAVYFTDDPGLAIRAMDITDLRKAVNAVRSVANRFASCPAYTFTDADAALPSSAVKGLHIQQLRDALGQARSILGLAALTYTYPNVDPAANGGQELPILHDDVVSLRGGVQ